MYLIKSHMFSFYPMCPFIDWLIVKSFVACYMLDYGRNTQPPPEDWSKLLPKNERIEK